MWLLHSDEHSGMSASSLDGKLQLKSFHRLYNIENSPSDNRNTSNDFNIYHT